MSRFQFGVFTLFLVLVNLPHYLQATGCEEIPNGTILLIEETAEGTWTIRRHEQHIVIREDATMNNSRLYTNHSVSADTPDTLKPGDEVIISQVATLKTDDAYVMWLRVKKKEGLLYWLFLGAAKYKSMFTESFRNLEVSVLYYGDNWDITGYIDSGSREWTIRKLSYQRVLVWERIDIWDNPGRDGASVIGTIVPPTDVFPAIKLRVTEATEETETIDGVTDRWLKIEHEGVSGWIFGGYVSGHRLYSKYDTPDGIVEKHLYKY